MLVLEMHIMNGISPALILGKRIRCGEREKYWQEH